MTPQQPQALVGQWIPGGYRLKRFIASGAFAWVYFANTARGEAVAIKILQSNIEEARTMFAREVKVLRALPPNEHCVRYLDDGITDDGMPFLAMEYIDGITLKDALKAKPVWEAEEAGALMSQLCHALSGLHRLGVAHRDLKPENVMLTRDSQVKLMDLGLVKDAQGLLKLFEDEDILTGRDFAENIDRAMLAGTPEYMAPEQFSDPLVEDESQAKTDTWSDVYSLGLIFYELLVGQKLFPFKPATSDSGAYARAMLDYVRLRTATNDDSLHRPEAIPPTLWQLLARSLRQDPKRRYRDATEFGDAIQHYLKTGETPEFQDDESTSMADMGQLMAALQMHRASVPPARPASAPPRPPPPPPPSARGASRALQSRPGSMAPPVDAGAPEIGWSETEASPPQPWKPPLDIPAIQAMREQALNAPGSLDMTLPPGKVTLQQLGVPPTAQSSLTAPPSSVTSAPPAPGAVSPSSSSRRPPAWLIVTGLAAAGGVALLVTTLLAQH